MYSEVSITAMQIIGVTMIYWLLIILSTVYVVNMLIKYAAHLKKKRNTVKHDNHITSVKFLDIWRKR